MLSTLQFSMCSFVHMEKCLEKIHAFLIPLLIAVMGLNLMGLKINIIERTSPQEKILQENVKMLTFTKGHFTVGKRFGSFPQLVCVGGSYRLESHHVHSVMCNNTVSGWKCHAELPGLLQIHSTKVICEHYENDNDPHILIGSCRLEYCLGENIIKLPIVIAKQFNFPITETFVVVCWLLMMLVFVILVALCAKHCCD